MKPPDPYRAVLLSLAGWTVVCSAAFAQGTAPTPAVVETARVDLVNVEVFVTGKDGQPLRGLRREDFELLEDGKAVAVTNFAVLDAPSPTPVAAQPASGEAPAPTTEKTSEPEPSAPSDGMLSLVIYVDNANISLTRRNEVLAALRTLLAEATTRGRARVMLVSGGNSVRIRQAFTVDSGALTAALDGMRHEAAESGGASGGDISILSRTMDHTTMGDGSDANPAGDQIHSLLVQARSAAEAEYERSRSMLRMMTQFVGSLAGLPGRKVMFYVGQGLPMRPGEEMLQKFEALYANSGVAPGFSAAAETSRFNMGELFRDFVRRANAGGITVYCVDAGGGGRGAVAEQASMTADPAIQTGGGMGLRQALDFMAGPTGGRTIAPGAGVEAALTRAVEDLASGYSLAWAPAHGHDGAYHALKVRVRADGAAVRVREGYLDWTTDDRMAAASLAGVLFDMVSNPLGAGISVKADGRGKGDTYAMTVLVTIPIDRLVLQPRGQAHEGSVSLWFAGLNPDSGVTQVAKQVFPIRIPNDKLLTALGQAAGYTFRLELRKGEHRVAVTLRDDLGESESTLATAFDVGGNAAPGTS